MRSLPNRAVILLHWMAALAVLVVPAYAIVTAWQASFFPSEDASLNFEDDAPRWRTLLANTAIVSGVAVTVALLLGTAAGALTGRTNLHGRRAALVIISYLACLPPFVIVAIAFAVVPPWATPQSAWLCGALYGLTYAPLAALAMHARLRGVDAELEDCARLDASPAAVFRCVTLPQAAGGAGAAGLVVGLLVATDFTIADLMQVRTYAQEVYTQYALHHSPAAPLLTGAPAFIALFALLALALRRRSVEAHSGPGGVPREFRLGAWGQSAAIVFFIAWFALLAAPIMALAVRAGSVAHFISSLHGASRELLLSMVLSVCAAALMVLLAVGFAYGLVRTTAGQRFGPIALAALLALPAPVAGVSLIGMLNRPGWSADLLDSPAVIVIGYIVRLLPIAVLLVAPAVRRVPLELEWLARMDGADWFSTQRHVFWPAARLDALVAGLVLIILAFGEVGCTVMLRPPGWEVVSAWIFTELHKGLNRDVAAVALASCGCILAAWLGLVALMHTRRSAHERIA